MNEQSKDLTHFLTDHIEAVKSPGAKLEYETTASVGTESESTILTVRFSDAESSQDALNIRQLLEELQARTTLAEIDLFPTPHARLAIHGASGNQNYKVNILL